MTELSGKLKMQMAEHKARPLHSSILGELAQYR